MQHRDPVPQIYESYPALGAFYFDFEKNFDATKYNEFALKYWPHVPVAFVTAYLAMIHFGQKYMKKHYGKEKDPFKLKKMLAVWNLGLALFSFIGMTKTVPQLLHILQHRSVQDTICEPSRDGYGTKASGLWVMLFIFSKIPELVDTVFIVFRNTSLIFLHWYHHVTVLLFCWHAFAYETPTGLYFVAMNYSVHAIMYSYYFLMAIDSVPKWLKSHWITIAQISQMIVGTTICIMSYFSIGKSDCDMKSESVYAGALMYASYLYLFVEFYVQRFFKSANKKNKRKSIGSEVSKEVAEQTTKKMKEFDAPEYKRLPTGAGDTFDVIDDSSSKKKV
jgi:elongation of very long chain fatty acids protein 6